MSNDLDPERGSITMPQLRFVPEKFELENERPARTQIKDIYPQIIASIFATLPVMQAGFNISYSAIMLPQLMSPGSTFRVSEDEASWIASLVALFTPVGALVSGPLMDLVGRKVLLLVATLPLALSWFLIFFTPNALWMVYLARVLAGFGGGMTVVSVVYVSEISDVSWRPVLLCLNSAFMSLGILLTNLLGVLLPWREVALYFGILTVVSAVAIALYNPESPQWLLTFRHKSNNQAKESLKFLCPNHEMFIKEWDRLISVIQDTQGRETEYREGFGILDKVKHTTEEFNKSSSTRPMAILLVIFLFQQLSGIYPIIFYAVQVFQSIGDNFGLGLNADSATVLLGIVRFLLTILTTTLSSKCGRRTMILISGIGMTISSLVAAVYFQNSRSFESAFNIPAHVNSTGFNATSLVGIFNSSSQLTVDDQDTGIGFDMIGLICVLVFVGMGSVGLAIIPWTLVGEILPVSIRGTGGGFLFSFAYILMFGFVKVFPFMLELFQASGAFYFFSLASFISVIVVYLFLPETLGKSIDEIERYFISQKGVK